MARRATRMIDCDLSGKPWLTVEEAKAGLVVMVDGDFTCIGEGEKRVLRAEEGLYFLCSGPEGRKRECKCKHWLDGQLSRNGKCYIGLYCAKGDE